MTKTEKKKLAIILISLFCVIGIFGILSGTYAKYKGQESNNINAKLYSFEIKPYLEYISDEGIKTTVGENEIKNNNGILRLSLSEYSTLKLNGVYKGEGKSYIRFKIIESWQHTVSDGTEIMTPKQLSSYILNDKIYDNRSDDGYLYYTEPLSANGSTNQITVPLISKCTAGQDADNLISSDDKSTFVDIAVSIEAVQFNRMEDLWGISQNLWKI